MVKNKINDQSRPEKSKNKEQTNVKKTKQTANKISKKSISKTKSKSRKKSTASENVKETKLLEPVSTREEKFVVYDEAEYELKELPISGSEILIGPNRLTRFEKARITGARSLQLSFGAPLMIKANTNSRSSISLAIEELDQRALPISIRRVLPNGVYQDIPLEWMKP